MANPTEQAVKTIYHPSRDVIQNRTDTYADINRMVEERNRSWKQFNGGESGDRTLIAYINDSDRRLNGYTSTRESAGKESWMSNFFHPITRNKMKAFIAGVALNVPEIMYKAVNKNGVFSSKRAEVMKQLVKHSRVAHGNPQLDIFFEAWEAAGKGTVVKYDGYLRTTYKRKYIKSFNTATGEVEFEEKDEQVDDKPIDIQVPLSEFFISDFYIFDVQEQPAIAWIQYYNLRQIEQEFSKYPNYKYIKSDKNISGQTQAQHFKADVDTYYYDHWHNRTKENGQDFEVVKYYNKQKDSYEIWINGVDMLRAPLLWGKCDKIYPFSKTIFEPFDAKNFFYGKSFPHVMEGIQDTDNTLRNTIIDKLYRSLTPPMLVGLANKDLLDIEDELVNQDNKIYVPDVSQVKPMPFDGVNQGEISMLEVVARSADLTASIDQFQQGIQGKGVTAREIIAADEHARKLKGVFYMFLEDLWLQKTRIRIQNILTHYMQPTIEKVAGKEGTEVLKEAMKILNVPDVEFSDGTVGTLGIQIAQNDAGRQQVRAQGAQPAGMLTVPQIEAREMAMNNQGINYKLVAMSSDYLDDWEYDFVVMPESLWANEQGKNMTFFQDKIQQLMTVFPEYMASNKEKLFKDFIEMYGEAIEDYQPPAPQPMPMEEVPEDQNSPLAQGEQQLNGSII